MKLLKFSDLSALSPDDLARELQERYQTWNCPGCDHELAIRRDLPLPVDRRCKECQERESAWTPHRREIRQLGREEALEAAGCPAMFRAPFKARKWPRADGNNADVEAWSGEPRFIGFLGDSDSGKTAMASELFWRRLQVHREGIWIRADALVSGLFRNDERSLEACGTKLLMIDDLGWGVLGASIERLFGVIAERHADLRETIWTSNQGLGYYAKTSAGQALTRRLHEGLLVPCKGNWRDALIAGGAE